MKPRLPLIIGTSLLAIGLFLIAPIAGRYLTDKQQTLGEIPRASAAETTQSETPVISGEPSRITFPNPKVGIDIEVTPGEFNASNNTWTLSEDKAHFATATTIANNKTGNTFIYGHNKTEVFSKLLHASLGDTAVVTTDNDHRFTYRLLSIRDVDPSDATPLANTELPTLTVQTCSGLWLQDRRIFTYELVEAV